MVLYYLSPYLQITHEFVEIRRPVRLRYAIRDLHAVYIQRDPTAGDPRQAYAAVPVVASAMFLGSPTIALVLLLLVVAATWVALVARNRRHRVLRLWALHHGQPVLLYESADRLEFGKVERALLRAMERMQLRR